MKIALAAGFALVALPLSVESLRFSVEKEDMASCAWTIVTNRETITSTLTLMGDDKDVGTGSSSMRTLQVELSDEYLDVDDDGIPTQIARSFEALLSEMSNDNGDGETDSELVGETVVFGYDAEEEEWSAEYGEDSDGEADWLDGLIARIDLAGVLPEDDAEFGDSWELPPTFLAAVLKPGGQLMVQATEEDDEGEEGSIQITLPGGDNYSVFEEFEGDVTATLKEIVDEDDKRVAMIVVTVDVEADVDIIDQLEDQADERGADEAYSDATLTRTLEGELIVLWNLETNRPESLGGELSGNTELNVEWTSSNGDFDLELGFASETNESFEIEATFSD
jgi:hypothetical protein